MLWNQIKLGFPVWQYLNQPLFQINSRTVLNPYRFRYLYQVQLLERCLAKKCESRG